MRLKNFVVDNSRIIPPKSLSLAEEFIDTRRKRRQRAREEGRGRRRVVNNPLLVTLILWISLFAQPPRRDESEPGGNARARSMHLCMTRESSNNIFLLLSSRR